MQSDSNSIISIIEQPYYLRKKARLNSKSPTTSNKSLISSTTTTTTQTATTKKHDSCCWTFWCYECKTFCCFLSFLCLPRRFYSVKMYLFILCLLILSISLIIGGYISAITTNLQTQFNIPTNKIGLLHASYNIMSIVATPLVSYIGTRYNKSRIIGICGFIYCTGAIIMTLPFFISPKYEIKQYSSNRNNDDNGNALVSLKNETIIDPFFIYDNETGNFTDQSDKVPYQLCSFDTIYVYNDDNPNKTTSLSNEGEPSINSSLLIDIITTANSTSNDSTSTKVEKCVRNRKNTWQFDVFVLGQLFMSLGNSPIFSLGITYLCDNSPENYHAIYTGN
jgi:MFS family permease